MAKIKLIHDLEGQTLTVWFDDPAKESVCEETTQEVVLIKDAAGRLIGFELLHYVPSEPGGLAVETIVQPLGHGNGAKTNSAIGQTDLEGILQRAHLNWQAVKDQYIARVQVSERLFRLLGSGNAADFAQLALGISDPNGNYSAREHGVARRILADNPNAAELILTLARTLARLESGIDFTEAVKRAGIINLGIAVGSELASLVNPQNCWITNRRTVWAYYLLKNGGTYQLANEAIKLTAEHGWSAFHNDIQEVLVALSDAGSRLATRAKVQPGTFLYLWGEAIANEMYERFYH